MGCWCRKRRCAAPQWKWTEGSLHGDTKLGWSLKSGRSRQRRYPLAEWHTISSSLDTELPLFIPWSPRSSIRGKEGWGGGRSAAMTETERRWENFALFGKMQTQMQTQMRKRSLDENGMHLCVCVFSANVSCTYELKQHVSQRMLRMRLRLQVWLHWSQHLFVQLQDVLDIWKQNLNKGEMQR